MSCFDYSLSVTKYAELLAEKKVSSEELCSIFIRRRAEIEPYVNAFLSFDEASIMEAAKASTARRTKGNALSEYDGIPIAIKDNIAVCGQPCTCASKILENFVSPYDATVIKKLKEKGFILFGRTNMDEFAMGSSCENSAFKKTKNPWDLSRVPGGSSGGSAAAVAARQVPVALGSDTGGSIRQPASFCGCTGLKPTYGTVSRYGLVAFASSLDQIGPMANNVSDLEILYDIISGKDDKDATSISGESENKISGENLSGIKIGLPREYFEIEGLDEEVKKTTLAAIETLKGAGAEIIEISLPNTKYAIADYYVIATAEASANLARFDGIRYGRRVTGKDLLDTYFKTRGAGFGPEVKRRIILGTFVLSSGYYDAYYLRAQKLRTLIRRDFLDAFKRCDALLSPVSPVPAFKFGEKADPLQMYLADIFTISVNLAGICAVSVPADLHPSTGMPIGIQFMGAHFGEKTILRISQIFESLRSRHDFLPNLCITGGSAV